MTEYAPFTGRIRHVGQDAYLPLQVTLDELDAQHEAGWTDFHPEDFCHRCGNRNVSWAIEGDVWASVMNRGESDPWHGIVCIPCFTELHALVHGESAWHMVYDENGTTRLSIASTAARDAQVLRDAALSGDFGTTAQSTLLRRADRIAGGTSA